MSDIDTLRRMKRYDATLDRLKTRETPAIYPPFVQRVLNPFPLASSGNPFCDMGQPWAVYLLAWYCTVYVSTTNNGTNYWTVTLRDAGGSILGTFNTSAIAANTTTRFAVTSLTQPSSSNSQLYIQPNASNAPGAIFIYPTLALVRTE